MSEHYCPECRGNWNGAYTCELRCTQCGSALKARDCERLDPEVEIKELNSIVAQLSERADKAEQREQALAAHVERLGKIGRMMACSLSLCEDPAADMKDVGDWEKAMRATPKSSLARFKAQWQAEALEELIARWKLDVPTDRVIQHAAERAAELRRQAEGDNDEKA